MTSILTPGGSVLLMTSSLAVIVVDYLHGVRADLAANVENDGGLVLVVGERALLGHAVFGVTDIAHPDRRAAHVLDDDVVELVDAARRGPGFERPARWAADDASAGRFDVLGLNRCFDVLRAQVVGVQLVQIHDRC